MMTDKERLDFLQEQTKGYGNGWLVRDSIHGRGIRLHETRQDGATPNIREAIDNYAKSLLDIEEINNSYEYEVLIKDNSIFEEGAWVPIATEKIKRPENIEKYIRHGILREINR